MKKIDFSKIEVKGIDGKPYMVQKKEGENTVLEQYDFAKVLGNGLFYGGRDIRMAEIGQKMYHHEAVELSDAEVAAIREFISGNFFPFVLISVLPQYDELTKQ